MKTVCFIPARGGSVRIPRKNIRLFHGKPIIAYVDKLLIPKQYRYAAVRILKNTDRPGTANRDINAIVKEGDIAAALGVSRPQANNYRHGKTVFDPTEAQIEAILCLFDNVLGKLTKAKSDFELAVMGA